MDQAIEFNEDMFLLFGYNVDTAKQFYDHRLRDLPFVLSVSKKFTKKEKDNLERLCENILSYAGGDWFNFCYISKTEKDYRFEFYLFDYGKKLKTIVVVHTAYIKSESFSYMKELIEKAKLTLQNQREK